MEINATLFGQMITFAIFVWFTMRFVWPVLEKTLEARALKISEGLEAANRGHIELALAQKQAVQQIHESKQQALAIIAQAEQQAVLLIEEAKQQTHLERQRFQVERRTLLEQERLVLQQQLKGEFSDLLVMTTQKLLGRLLTPADQKALLAIHDVDELEGFVGDKG